MDSAGFEPAAFSLRTKRSTPEIAFEIGLFLVVALTMASALAYLGQWVRHMGFLDPVIFGGTDSYAH